MIKSNFRSLNWSFERVLDGPFMFSSFSPFISISDLHTAYTSSLTSCPNNTISSLLMFLLVSRIKSLQLVSIPPVPQAGSYIVLMISLFFILSPFSMNINCVISLITSLGVKCSPASSLDCSANFRINSSKIIPISWLETMSGCKSTLDSENFLIKRNNKLALAKRVIWVFI